jgi:predicted AAA+ superfamily ATPase
MSDYIPRLLDPVFQDYLSFVPAFAIEGVKASGKTSSAEKLAQTSYRLDIESTRELLASTPNAFLRSEKPVLVDEWQRMPQIWDMVRREVDDDFTPGRFILTGSAYPIDTPIHSGAGRIITIRMRPLSIAERFPDETSISLRDLLHKKNDEVSGSTNIGIDQYLLEITKSGFPGIRSLPERGASLYIESYLDNLTNREFDEQGFTVRKPTVFRNWLKAYAAATGSTSAYQVILDAATPDEKDKHSKSATIAYRDILDKLYLTDRVEPWLPVNSQFKYLGKIAKHYLADPALAVSLLGITMNSFFDDSRIPRLGPQEKSIAGRLFESLVALSLQTYTQVAEARLGHFRSNNGRQEVDFIVEKGNNLAAIEVKLSSSPDNNSVDTLNWFEQTFSNYQVSKILITTGDTAYTRHDKVHVIPAALLAP